MMVLYSGTTCPFSHRCRFVLFEKGMDFEIRDVDSNSKRRGATVQHTSCSRRWSSPACRQAGVTAGSAGAAPAAAPDPLSRRAGAECQVEIKGRADARTEDNGRRGGLRSRAQRAGAHDLGAVA